MEGSLLGDDEGLSKALNSEPTKDQDSVGMMDCQMASNLDQDSVGMMDCQMASNLVRMMVDRSAVMRESLTADCSTDRTELNLVDWRGPCLDRLADGMELGCDEGSKLGRDGGLPDVGWVVGKFVGSTVGLEVGCTVGVGVGLRVGLAVGRGVGFLVGCRVGWVVGWFVGLDVGIEVVGWSVGFLEGWIVGLVVG
eukprot:CCRYP_001066-RE/>CCRYP_001066-RE protein AED:0.45 eAED:0.45 QI:0/0/0/1/0/0/3/0/194